MNLRARIGMESKPELHLQATTGPVAFKTKARGALTGKVSAIVLRVSEIPIHVAVPFSRRRGGLHQMAAIGSFGIKVAPFSVSVEGAEFQLVGVLGQKDGIKTTVEGRVCCQSKLKVEGKLYGKIAGASLELPEEEFEEGVDAM